MYYLNSIYTLLEYIRIIFIYFIECITLIVTANTHKPESEILKLLRITRLNDSIHISDCINKIYHKIELSSIKGVICYEIKINKTSTDLKDGYISHDGDLFYKMIIETHNNRNDVELIYNSRDEIIRDEEIILAFISIYETELKKEKERLYRYEMMD